MPQRVAIVGIGQTHHRSRRPEVNQYEMISEAVRAALADAELGIKDIDAVLVGNMETFEGHYLADLMAVGGSGGYLKPGLKLNTGGTVGGAMVCAGWYHVASGLFDTVLVVAWQKLEEGHTTSGIISAMDPLYDRVFYTGAISHQAMIGQQYMNATGCPEEHAALVRVKAAENARRNPYAHVRTQVSVEDVLNSRIVVYPIRLLEMCPVSSGACALVLASEDRARTITNKPVWIRDHVTTHLESFKLAGEPDPMPPTASQTAAAVKLYKRNGITNPRRDIDVFELYDPSSWAELAWMEDFLLCERGEAWKLVERGVSKLDGEFPINPSGGVVSTNPIGATAMIRVAEAAIQIRGDGGDRQVARPVRRAVATAYGGSNWTIMFLLSKHTD